MLIQAQPPDPHPDKPQLTCPPGAVDCHMHLFGPQADFPYAPGSKYISAELPPETYFKVQETLEIEYAVFVSSGGYGANYAYLSHVLERYPGRFRGIALLPETVTPQEIEKLDRLGVRGARFVSPHHGGALPDISPHIAGLIREFGWHIQYYPHRTDIVEFGDMLAGLDMTVVLDHFAHIPAEGGVDQPAVRKVMDLLDTGRFWLKLSGPMRCTDAEPPYAAVTPIARAFVRHAPERLIWGSDWPHVNMNGRTMPNDGKLLDLMLEWVPDEAVRNRILSGNAQALFGFPPRVSSAEIANGSA